MKLDMELKPGDIKLLKILGCILIIFFCVRFLIFPAIEKSQDLSDEKYNVNETKTQMQQTIDSKDTLDAKIEKQQKELDQAKSGYYDLLENQEVDELLTGIALNNSMMPVYLKIESTNAQTPAAYQSVSDADDSSDSSDTESTDTLSDSSDDADEGETTSTEVYQYVNTTQVSMTLQGTEEEFRNLLNDVAKNYPGVQMQSFEMDEGTYVDANLQTVSSNSYKCVLSVYTCGVLDDAQEASEE